jgi:hypothetical protein
MTAQAPALSIDHTVLSDADAARVAAEDALHKEWARRTAVVVAAASRDGQDCRMLLDILGIGVDVVAAARAQLPAPAAAPAPRKSAGRKGARAA